MEKFIRTMGARQWTKNESQSCRENFRSLANKHHVVFYFADPVTERRERDTRRGRHGGSRRRRRANAQREWQGSPVDLMNVSNRQTLTVNLLGVSGPGLPANISVPMDVLLGDVTANRSVNSSDIGSAKSQSGLNATTANFRADVTANGSINSSDIGTVKANSGTSLP